MRESERDSEREREKERETKTECLEIGFKTPPVKKFILTTNEFLRRLYD